MSELSGITKNPALYKCSLYCIYEYFTSFRFLLHLWILYFFLDILYLWIYCIYEHKTVKMAAAATAAPPARSWNPSFKHSDRERYAITEISLRFIIKLLGLICNDRVQLTVSVMYLVWMLFGLRPVH